MAELIKIAIINGPNLNLLGTREPEVYGSQTFEAYLTELGQKYSSVAFSYFQSNVEGELVSKLQEFAPGHHGILLNAAAYTHTSIALADAIAGIKCPVVEIHISNIFAREDYRHVSFLGRCCIGSVSGFGLQSYELGLQHFLLPRAGKK